MESEWRGVVWRVVEEGGWREVIMDIKIIDKLSWTCVFKEFLKEREKYRARERMLGCPISRSGLSGEEMTELK